MNQITESSRISDGIESRRFTVVIDGVKYYRGYDVVEIDTKNKELEEECIKTCMNRVNLSKFGDDKSKWRYDYPIERIIKNQ